MMKSLQCSYPDQHNDLVEILSMDLNWIICHLSDRYRIHVQIMIGLICPFNFILLDEIMTSCLISNNNNHATKEVI